MLLTCWVNFRVTKSKLKNKKISLRVTNLKIVFEVTQNFFIEMKYTIQNCLTTILACSILDRDFDPNR